MSKPNEKIVFEQHEKCPYCSRLIHTRVVRVTVKEAVKGQTELQGFLEKEIQSTLEKDYQAYIKKVKKQVTRKAF